VTKMQLPNVVMVIVAPTARRAGHYDARLQDGGVIVQAPRHPRFAWFTTRARPILVPIMQAAA
jgi:hypothetical protein